MNSNQTEQWSFSVYRETGNRVCLWDGFMGLGWEEVHFLLLNQYIYFYVCMFCLLGTYTYKHVYLILKMLSEDQLLLLLYLVMESWLMTEIMLTSIFPSTLSKICLLEITSAQKTHCRSLVELQIRKRSMRILNGQTTGFCARRYLSNISMSPDILYYHYLL